MPRRLLLAGVPLLGAWSAASGGPAASGDPAQAPDRFSVPTPRGAVVSVLTDVPAGRPPFPALVVAPGAGYPAEAPLHAELAAAAVDAGYLVFRMDWAYWREGGNASPDLSDEREDLRTVLERVRTDPRVDPGRVTLAGKSLGSLVAHAVFAEDPALRALVLLTPLCVRAGGAPALDERYPGLASEERPVVLLYGTADPACPGEVLAAALGERENVTVLAVPGDHGLRTGDEEADADNVRSAAASVVEALGAP